MNDVTQKYFKSTKISRVIEWSLMLLTITTIVIYFKIQVDQKMAKRPYNGLGVPIQIDKYTNPDGSR